MMMNMPNDDYDDCDDCDDCDDSYHHNPKKNVRYYPSDIVGNFIVNAINGAKYPWKVGSFDENRFFKVIDTANRVTFRSPEYGPRVTHKLYYDSPMDYMKHRNIVLEKSVIDNWQNKMKERGLSGI